MNVYITKLCLWECAVATCKRENIIFVNKVIQQVLEFECLLYPTGGQMFTVSNWRTDADTK